MKSLKLLAVLIGAAAIALSASPARAALIVSDSLTVTNSAGLIVGQAVSSEPEAANTIREVDTNLADPGQIGDYYLVFEPDGTTLSDIVGIEHGLNANGTAHAVFAYVSSPFTLADWVGSGKAFDGKQLGSFVETTSGGTFDISNLINPKGGAKGGTASFFSDGNVPDGGSAVALLGIALAGIEATRRMIRARKA